ncbi:hypothetical protein COCMIDRAFT_6517 [Bipolaris oryzae ATCC 44560]|uniref:Uncharacterized protein n=1 Tax=Bipolaris oryzae ATCC 44560 TaxID=930090 RepID=W6ZKJ8_COCMI|nr:uncharacterized protein COCMIDRAFT_6517 [Bipolaris oryzae ATCC 44560]EUC44106.1 hypothetical protein COCMIDRAFT_6517 [Bipolaris oryzae ATCC 44560]
MGDPAGDTIAVSVEVPIEVPVKAPVQTPTEDFVKVPVNKEKSKEHISPLTGKELSKHEKWGLKSLEIEQHPVFWERVIYWCREWFTEAKWREVVRRIERAAKEDKVIVFGWYPPMQPTHSTTAKGIRRLLCSSSSSLTSSTGPHPLRPAHLPRIASSSSASVRPRWDIVASGPPTPLSATSGPMKNAFAEGGVWASLSPKTPASVASVAPTPVTAVPLGLWASDPPNDPDAKAAYNEVRRDVKKMALHLCANRHALRLSSDGQHDVIHPSMVKPKDELQASQYVLDSCQLDLSKHTDTTLPNKIEELADDEASHLRHYSIQTIEKLEDVDSWLTVNEYTGEISTTLDAQRNLLRANREKRQNRETQLTEEAVQYAWAAKIVEDAEHIVKCRAEAGEEDSSDDEGYDYENFIRSLRSASSSCVSLLEENTATRNLILRDISSGASTIETSQHSTRTPGYRSTSNPTPTPSSLPPSDLPFRNHNSIPASPSHRSTSTTSAHPLRPRPRPTFITTTTTPNLNTDLRTSRRHAPTLQDLTDWADELKKMERKRTELRLTGSLTYETDVHPALRPAPAMECGMRGEFRGSMASTESSVSWRCETASLVEREGAVTPRGDGILGVGRCTCRRRVCLVLGV